MKNRNRPTGSRNSHPHLTLVEPDRSALSELEAARCALDFLRTQLADLSEVIEAVQGILGTPVPELVA